MRVAIAGIQHESNTFVAQPTRMEAFAPSLRVGAAIAEEWAESHHEVAGYFEGGREAGFELVPVLMAAATPGGTVAADALETLTGELIERLNGERLDGLLLALHGAMVAEGYPDGDGEILRRVRAAVGPDLPIVTTLDFHANISPAMREHATALLVYRTNPHVDQRPRGRDAAALMHRILRDGVKPVMRGAQPPLVWNILHQNTSVSPLRDVLEASRAVEAQPGVLTASVAVGYPYSDVEEAGPSSVVVTDGNAELAAELAESLASAFWSRRDELAIHLPDAAGAIRQAMGSAERPVILVEMGDNIGGGSPGDSTILFGEIVRQRAEGSIVTIYDPESVEACARAGADGTVSLRVGGKTDDLHGAPVAVEGRVRSLHEGKFIETQPRHGGRRFWDQGPTAVVELPGGNTLVVNSHRTAPMSLEQLRSLDLRPEEARMIVVKAAIAYRAAYEPIAGRIIEVDTPGVTAVNPAHFTYQHIRRPLWPLD